MGPDVPGTADDENFHGKNLAMEMIREELTLAATRLQDDNSLETFR
ncbi:hypothetical protein RISK_001540 [Rhodopirellula islandica]|uniref:Uncharacterized protein n=1 Tax=Rhodopirellula islandica TaxID=595434 RepID=A0A0J1ELB5_RHOIS|nr:hypothetical protein RISK_001540 [Rhodopirellula islandica]